LVFQTWATTQAIINMFLPIVKLCVLIQNASYWLLSNALHSTFTLCIAMKANVTRA
jgi:divalent metal cation (Fe/Co/Zn/Cd) transporter